MANTPDCLSGDRGFESRRGCHLVPSSKRLGRQPLKLVMLGSNPAGITIYVGVAQLAEQRIDNPQAEGSSPSFNTMQGSLFGKATPSYGALCGFESRPCNHMGRYANWLKQAVCKTVTLETLLVQIQPGPPICTSGETGKRTRPKPWRPRGLVSSSLTLCTNRAGAAVSKAGFDPAEEGSIPSPGSMLP